jgi:hypothetical protein
MNTATLAIGLALLMAAIASAYTYAVQRKQRKIAGNAHRIALAVKEYFAKSGAEIGAQCHPVHGRFLVLVESEPLKRFRYSHIVEASLISYVEKTLGLHVDRVFWRFPLPVGASSAQDTADLKPSPREDEYVVQGIRQAISNPDYHVAEDSWDQFEKARQSDLPAAEELNDQSR